ncbi:hypothetical protein [Marinisporobacter balticus]|uniref:Uncharacterized protein n=1 Tax=Marinisporobacter balticus TaxID=2018667 RepID=A0A4R2KLL2_9FIRM|nr:hypothetical protein [Marinisporobacter balticus]TCO74931.1 hypothetical protein EV214_1102 [Marinisporobacter balticus]
MDTDMTLSQEGQVKERSKKKNKKNNKIWIKLLIFLVSVGVWSGAVYYGYTYAKNYIDGSIKNVQQQNALNIQNLSEEIELLSQEIKNLKNRIENTGDTISDSTVVQEKIDKKLLDLDGQLKTLEKSLKILREAPNGQN